MLSDSPAVLITRFNPSFDVILANLLIPAGIPTLCGTSAPLRVDSGGTNVTLRWEDPSTIPEVFDTGHTIRTVVLGLPDSVGRVVLWEMKSFADLAKRKEWRDSFYWEQEVIERRRCPRTLSKGDYHTLL